MLRPRGCCAATDPHSGILVADSARSCILRVGPAGDVEPIAVVTPADEDSMRLPFAFTSPRDVASLFDGSILVADGRELFQLWPAPPGDRWEAVLWRARLNMVRGPKPQALGICACNDGGFALTDRAHRVLRVDRNGGIRVLAGGAGCPSFADGPGPSAGFSSPTGIVELASGDLLVADSMNSRLRLVSAEGEVSTVAGSGVRGATDGIGVNATFRLPLGLAIDDTDKVIIGDLDEIRCVDIAVGTVNSERYASRVIEGPHSTVRRTELYPVIDNRGRLHIVDTHASAISTTQILLRPKRCCRALFWRPFAEVWARLSDAKRSVIHTSLLVAARCQLNPVESGTLSVCPVLHWTVWCDIIGLIPWQKLGRSS